MTEPRPAEPELPATAATLEATVTAPAPARLSWTVIAVAAPFAVLYVYYVWDAVRSLLELPGYYLSIGLTRAQVPWWLLFLALVVPIAAYAIAWLVGRGRKPLIRALVFAVGLCVVACLTLTTIGLEAVLRPIAGG